MGCLECLGFRNKVAGISRTIFATHVRLTQQRQAAGFTRHSLRGTHAMNKHFVVTECQPWPRLCFFDPSNLTVISSICIRDRRGTGSSPSPAFARRETKAFRHSPVAAMLCVTSRAVMLRISATLPLQAARSDSRQTKQGVVLGEYPATQRTKVHAKS